MKEHAKLIALVIITCTMMVCGTWLEVADIQAKVSINA